jgi:hypothetical protein
MKVRLGTVPKCCYIINAVDELTCPRCRAVSVPATSAGLCPHCSYNFRAPMARIRLAAAKYGFPVLFVALGILLLRNGFPALVIIGVASFAWACSKLAEKSQTGLHERPVALKLDAGTIHNASVPLSMPTMPGEWQPVALLSRPRDVYLPLAAQARTFLFIIIFFAFGGVALRQSVVLIQNHSFRWYDLPLMFPIATVPFIIAGIMRDLIAAREILRDGELTPAILTDWRQSRHGIHLKYQFWTISGQKFEGEGKLNSKKELGAKENPLLVFYLPQNPKSSVALCCTPLRLRLGGSLDIRQVSVRNSSQL